MPIVEMLRSFAAEKQATPAQVSLAWMLRKYTNVVPIPGSKNKERIMENLRACEMQLTDEEFDRLDSELDRLPVYGIRGHAETEQTSFGNNWLKLNNSSMKRILILGASGTFGKALVEKLSNDEECHLTLASRHASACYHESERCHVVDCDAMKADDLQQAMAGCHVVYCAISGDDLPVIAEKRYQP